MKASSVLLEKSKEDVPFDKILNRTIAAFVPTVQSFVQRGLGDIRTAGARSTRQVTRQQCFRTCV